MFMLIKIEDKWVEYEIEKKDGEWLWFKNPHGKPFVLSSIIHANHIKESKRKAAKPKKERKRKAKKGTLK